MENAQKLMLASMTASTTAIRVALAMAMKNRNVKKVEWSSLVRGRIVEARPRLELRSEGRVVERMARRWVGDMSSARRCIGER